MYFEVVVCASFFVLKGPANAHNISTQHLTTLLDRVVRSCEGAGQTRATSCNIQKCCNKNLTIFKLDPIPSNLLQHVVTGRPRVCRTLRATMLQNVVLKCCVRLLGLIRIRLQPEVKSFAFFFSAITSGGRGVGVIPVFIASSDLVVFLLVPHSMLTQRRCAPRPPLHICHIF